jgi:tetratricopeptide (TPR) repeat protein
VNFRLAEPIPVPTLVGGRSLRLGVVALLAIALGGCQYTAGGKNAAGVQYYQTGRYQEAAQYFQQAIQQKPYDGDGYYNLAATYHQLGKQNKNPADLAQAEKLYNTALDLNPNLRDAYRSLGVLLVETNRPDSAQRLMEGWYNANPSNAAAKVEIARLREEFGDRAGAKEYLQQALAVDPYDTRALAALGRIQELEGNTAQALANYQRSLFRNQAQPEVAARVASLRGTFAGSSTGTFANNSVAPSLPTSPNLFSAPSATPFSAPAAGDPRTVTQPPALLR